MDVVSVLSFAFREERNLIITDMRDELAKAGETIAELKKSVSQR